MKQINQLSRLRFPLRTVSRLPLAVAKSVIQILSEDKLPTPAEVNETVLVTTTTEVNEAMQATTTAEVNQTAQEGSSTPRTRRRPLLKYVPHLLKRRHDTTHKNPKGEEAPRLSDLIDHNIETIISLHMHAELKVGRHQRLLERLTAWLGRPSSFYITLLLVGAWIFVNLFGHYLRLPVFDPVPFSWLQGLIGLAALLMTILVLTTQNRQARFAERRKHLDLQVNLVVEHKVSKLIALVEELRRDMPSVKDRYDQEAEAMAEAVDPEAVFLALDETLAELDPAEEHMVIQSDFTMDVETSVTTQEGSSPLEP